MIINTCAPSTTLNLESPIYSNYNTAEQYVIDMATWEWRIERDQLNEYISNLVERWISREDILQSIKWIYEYED